MSKSNRSKGKFCSMVGCRIASPERETELQLRKEQGLMWYHTPQKSTTNNFKLTKTQRKEFRALAKPQHVDHPLQRKATLMERGHGIYMNLVSLLNKPEATRA